MKKDNNEPWTSRAEWEKLLSKAQATHERAREVIARFDETEKQADEVSRRTRELLGKNQPG